MKAFLTGVALCAVFAVGVWLILDVMPDFSSAAIYRTDPESVRLDPGMGQRHGDH
ncbi:hypothetical protein [Breoghania sp.]|uniref:hypothetical protein n=1 Tax=Breoghania sp. TaxID=2065378 RepID=UPI0026103BE4|nr:hypothetical protein [Breoghania sp.]MDJ0931411.1 hypothetical protein [Breoghania sp.]